MQQTTLALITCATLIACEGSQQASRDDAGVGDAMTNQNDGSSILDALMGDSSSPSGDASSASVDGPAPTTDAVRSSPAPTPPSTSLVHTDVIARLKNVPVQVLFINDSPDTRTFAEYPTQVKLDTPLGKFAFFRTNLPLGATCLTPRYPAQSRAPCIVDRGHTFEMWQRTPVRALRFATTAETAAVRKGTKYEKSIRSIDEAIDKALQDQSKTGYDIEHYIEQWNSPGQDIICPAP